jgi:hypothetical protein
VTRREASIVDLEPPLPPVAETDAVAALGASTPGPPRTGGRTAAARHEDGRR